jgi:carboxypeptidase Taq
MKREVFVNPAIKKILSHYRVLWALGHLENLAQWDLEVYMPEKAAKDRGEALAKLSSLYQQLFLDKEFVSLIRRAEEQSGKLNEYEAGVVRVLKRWLRVYQALPKEFVEEWERTTSRAKVAWRQAKEQNDFSKFKPFLEKLVELAIKKAEYLGFKEHPYDALVDFYEEGWTTKEIEKFFAEIYPPLKKILSQVLTSENYVSEHPLEKMDYDRHQAEALNRKVLNFLGADWGRLRIDVSAHPFTNSLSINDARITTWYHQKDFVRSLSSTLHEFGHALYELQVDPKLSMTPIGGGVSLGIHESQSRFWENFVGRSQEFIELFIADFAALSPRIKKFIDKEGVDGVYNYFNIVRPGLIRVEADELTYHFHIKLRFDLEKELIEGKIKVADLPGIWRERMKEYLGVKPKTDTEGVLQDIHWSMGAFGYFPTYSLGTFVSGMVRKKLEEDLGELPGLISPDGVGEIQQWLKQKIHRFGATYQPKKLLEKSLGKKFDSQPLIDYLKSKYISC